MPPPCMVLHRSPPMTTARGLAAAALVVLTLTVVTAAPSPPIPIGLPGCVTSCGDVEVPFPFGIGPANCSLPGFNLTCDHAVDGRAPRLLLGDLLQVKKIYLDSAAMDVLHSGDIGISWTDDALEGHGTFFAGGGPYRLAADNELTVLSCNTAATLRNGNVTMSGCITLCDTSYGSGGYPFCTGIGCCHAPVVTNHEQEEEGKVVYSDSYDDSYDVRIQSLGLNRSADLQHVPVHVLVAEWGWFDEQFFGSDDFFHQPPEFARMPVPVWLDWEVVGHGAAPDSDTARECRAGRRGGYTCTCRHGYQGNPYLPHGCKDVNECEHPEQHGCFGQCNNKQGGFDCGCPPGTQGNHEMPGGCVNSSALTGACERFCGNIRVPYPFGIQGIGPASCYMPGFNLTCDTRHGAPRLLVGNYGVFRVRDFDLPNSAVRVAYSGPILNTSGKSDAFFDGGGRLGIFERRELLPYSLSDRNELILMGCNAKATMNQDDGDEEIISGCASFCPDNVTDDRYIQRVRSCYGTGCCQARISMSTNGKLPSTIYYDQIDEKRSPMVAYVLIAEKGWFDDQQNFAGSQSGTAAVAAKDVPMLLQWEVLPPPGLPRPDNKSHPNCTQEVMRQLCRSMHSYCKPGNRGYTCHCQDSYHGNPYSAEDDGCQGGHAKHLTTGIYIAIGVAIGAGLILSVLIVILISNKLKHRRAKMLKRKFFEQNRGRLLQQLVSQRADIAERMIISLEELEKATNNFDKSRELGGGGHGIVYKGILSDLHVVAIKKPKKVVQKEIDEFINEVAILSQINHRNVVKLYGCCLETEVPMLVYEFISNGTLCEHLHVQGPSSLSWDNRLRIATETAGSLSYLHSTASVPIIHRDIKSGNILLDDSLTSKIADFGASRYVPVDRSGVTTMVQGTRGYLDPMYFYTGRLTEKSDVYSFGVMLVELLTRKKPFSYLSSEGEGLVVDFTTLYGQGNLSQILDPQVIEEEDKNVEKVAALAVECIRLRGEDRPTMKQVESTLGSIQSEKQQVPDITLVNTNYDGIGINFQSTAGGSDESTRRYSMENEYILSSRYPR